MSFDANPDLTAGSSVLSGRKIVPTSVQHAYKNMQRDVVYTCCTAAAAAVRIFVELIS